MKAFKKPKDVRENHVMHHCVILNEHLHTHLIQTSKPQIMMTKA